MILAILTKDQMDQTYEVWSGIKPRICDPWDPVSILGLLKNFIIWRDTNNVQESSALLYACLSLMRWSTFAIPYAPLTAHSTSRRPFQKRLSCRVTRPPAVAISRSVRHWCWDCSEFTYRPKDCSRLRPIGWNKYAGLTLKCFMCKNKSGCPQCGVKIDFRLIYRIELLSKDADNSD